ncbi:MAG TPA: MoaD/ThiS family protein [Thermoplasmata archaeon]|nr:MoaD/ThiS family protein [Thermoplasmata archaeon]
MAGRSGATARRPLLSPAGPSRSGEVRLLLFATAREAVGKASLSVRIPRTGLPLRGFLEALAHDHPGLGPILPGCRIARNGRYVPGPSARVRPGDEIAVHPPFSGG